MNLNICSSPHIEGGEIFAWEHSIPLLRIRDNVQEYKLPSKYIKKSLQVPCHILHLLLWQNCLNWVTQIVSVCKRNKNGAFIYNAYMIGSMSNCNVCSYLTSKEGRWLHNFLLKCIISIWSSRWKKMECKQSNLFLSSSRQLMLNQHRNWATFPKWRHQRIVHT